MCVMEIHPTAHRSTMLQAFAHNLSTIDRDLDMLRRLANVRKDHAMVEFVNNLQKQVHEAYAYALAEFEISCAEHAQDIEGHVHVGNLQNASSLVELIDHATKAARKDETR